MPEAVTIKMLRPRWMDTVGAMLGLGAKVRSCCCQCGTLQRVELADLIARHGPGWSLTDTLERCTIVGCIGSVYYLTARGPDRPWTVLVRDPALLEMVVAVTPAKPGRALG